MAYGNSFQRTTPVVLNLIIINCLVYFSQVAFGGSTDLNNVNDLFALHHYKAEVFRPYQLITHMFMHGSFFHLLFNMFALWMFGTMIERVWGPKKFILFYFICGIGAGLAQLGAYTGQYWSIDHTVLSADAYAQYQTILRLNATIGASGAIMGVLAAFAYLFPNTRLFIFPIPFPVKAKWAVLGFIVYEIFSGFFKFPGR